jgi:hypothetical protein
MLYCHGHYTGIFQFGYHIRITIVLTSSSLADGSQQTHQNEDPSPLTDGAVLGQLHVANHVCNPPIFQRNLQQQRGKLFSFAAYAHC